MVKPFEALRKPAAAALFVGLLLMYDPNSVWAASGGRMGGSSFSSRSSGSSRSSSSSSSWPKMRSYSHKPSHSEKETDNYKAVDVSFGLTAWSILFVACSIFVVNGILSDLKSVLKLQVGLLGLRRRSLQIYLNRIAETADTSTPEGLHYVLTETINALLEHLDFRIYVDSSDSSVEVKYMDGDKRFDELSLEERRKFDKETLVNIDNIKEKQSSTKLTTTTTGITNEYIVVTILVAAKGVHKLPSIKNIEDLKEALEKLASISSTRILGVEVLWTPQEEDDTLSEEEFLEDYPLLRPLSGAEPEI
ncbi:hypothetical protein ACJIZ3_006369 [Penstemon smallii]|uniref:Uncharacterized protein n=1 Tax=Penstemon smallii TaxID=265156 RepID=A0ABD3S7J5_9LAMI